MCRYIDRYEWTLLQRTKENQRNLKISAFCYHWQVFTCMCVWESDVWGVKSAMYSPDLCVKT